MKRALLLFLLVGNILVGATKTWNGTINSDWNTGANWTGGVPTTNVDDIVIAVGSANQPQFNSTAAGDSFVANPGFVTNRNGGSLTILPTYSFNTASLTVSPGVLFTFAIQNASDVSGFNTTLNIGANNIGAGSTASYSFTNPGGAVNPSQLNFNGAFSGTGSSRIIIAAGAQATVTIGNGIAATFRTITSVNSNDSFVLLNGASSITLTPDQTSSIAGVISGSGELTFNSAGHFLTLSNANTYTGQTSILNGIVLLSGSGAIAFSDAVIVNGSGEFDISLITSSTSINTLSGNSSGASIFLGSKTLTVIQGSNQTFAGIIQDGGNGGGTGGSLIKAGGSTLTLTGANTYTGTTTITAGTLALSGGGDISSSASVSIAGTFDISQITSSTSINTISGAGTISLGSKTLTINQGSDQTFSGTIQDGGIGGGTGGNLTKTGASTLTLSGANTYTGATTITAGTIALSGSGSIASSSSVSIAGTLDISQITSSTSINTISGAGTISLGSKALTVVQGSDQTFSGTIQDGGIGGGTGGSLIKAGSATLTLSGANTYTGGTTINAGTLSVSSDGNLGGSSGALTLAGGTLGVTNSFTLSASRTVTTTSSSSGIDVSSGQTFTIGQTISGDGAITKTNAGTLVFGGSNSYNGTTISGGTLSVSSDSNLGISSGALTLAGGTLKATASFTMASSRSVSTTSASSMIDVAAGQTLTITSGITGTGAITKIDTGTLVLTEASSYSGGTIISAGTLSLSGNGSLFSSGSVTDNGTFDISGISPTSTTIGDLSGSGTVNLGSKTLIAGTSTPSVTFSGHITGTGSFTKQGSGTLVFTNSNSYTGGTTISAGTLALSGSGSLDSNGFIVADGTFDISAITPATATIGNLSGSGAVVLGSKTLIFNTTGTTTFSGVISGTGGITQQGAGTLILSGINTYTGPSDILAGTLAIAGSISTGLTTIHSGATLSGTGVVFGPVVVQGGGLLTSGINGSTGDFSIPNTVTVQPNGTINVAPGLFSIRALVLGAPTFINSTNSPTAAGTLFAGPVDPDTGLDLSNTSITIDFQPGSYPSTPTIYAIFVSPVAFAEKFGSITVNGGPGFALYTPREFSNALVVPFNVPTGISIGNLLVGSTNFTSFILFDPCAGLVVLSLIPESNIASALAAFIANQCSLSASSLGQLATVINKKVSNQGGGKTGSLLAAPLALLEQEKNNFQHSKMPAPLPPAEYFLLAENVEEDDPVGSPKRLPWLPPLEPWFPKISLSMNLLGQFQSQNAIDTPFVAFPAYLTKTAGVILGLDYIGFKSLLLGGAVTYAYTDLQVAANGGSQATQSFFGTVYSGLIFGNWAMNFVVTGSYNYNRLIRNIAEQPPTTVTLVDESVFGFEETFLFQLPGIPAGAAHAKYDSYQVTPHFDLNYEIGLGSISILPFILSDTIITFEDRITETGAPPVIPSACGGATTLNTVIQTVVSYMLQNEVGINLLEQVDLVEKGILIFRQKASYVNRYILPYSLKANFVASPAPFVSIPIRFPIQHFCGATVESIYRRKLFSFILTYEGMYGSGYIFNAGFVRFARDF